MADKFTCDLATCPVDAAAPPLCPADPTERRRLATLESLQILNTLPEAAYDRIVRRVSEFFHAPICLISLAARENQWFKAKIGVDIDSAPREASFCQAALRQDDVLVIPDATLSESFRGHPFVVGPPNLRFYAGMPLVIEGDQKVGTLCIIDTKPRVLSASETEALKDFAALVVDELHLRLRTFRLEAELAQRRDNEAAALASQRARADFLAMVTHEVRAPLNAIAGMVEMICARNQPAVDEPGIDTLRDSTGQLVRMINEVLDLAQLEATGFTFNRQPFDLRRELRCALAVVRPQAANKGLALTLEVDPSVPEYVVGDRTRVSQIVLNLLTNAIKFTSQGSVRMTLDAQPDCSARTRVTFSVMDTGIGMSDEVARGLFESFSQGAPEMKARYGGTGLGLAICQKLVQAMGGTIACNSSPHVGTVFTCSIPFDIAPPDTLANTPALDTRPGIHRADHLVLIADDDDVSRKISKALLTRLGYRVETVASGREALAMLRTRPIDLAVVDINMPDLNGLELARELHEQTEFGLPAPLVAVTGRSKPVDDPRVDLFDDYLVKPVSATMLDRAIMDILSRRDPVVSAADHEGTL
ncbi:hybrid sensor histidine kinase/response regulator [Paraburkholderia bryophila]|uniref:Virulence sensor protein BvgS n=1 Tax=Paraburkholderia bryophila TaxID=420952 RepID=A0A7Z0B670_9BURK|nr:hybrid sensor histidine kinase/response regulator [Paraburkholderia bryophila]NYH21037.1 signal transduction histidine kinase/ActR/RegA family two-component response regulator [Paraburkholderia bryophila]